jgi:uncharacterized protein YdhG (YjbR/CyaY superfamily)
MKRKKSSIRGSVRKGSAPPKTVDGYLARVPEPARGALKKIRTAIRSAVPAEATETISYGAFSTSKGTIQFPTDKPVPTALIRKLVKARVAESESKKRA